MERTEYTKLKEEIRTTEGKARRYPRNKTAWARAEKECSPQQLAALCRMARQINEDLDTLDMMSGCL